MYLYGNGVEQDLTKAKKFYEKALADSDFLEDSADIEDKKYIKENIGEIDIKLEDAKKETEASRNEVFICYARKDEPYKDGLRPHLEMLKKTSNIKYWDDRQIKSGEDWDNKIKEALSKARVAVLMISAHFFTSEYVWREELPPILESASREGMTILWLPVSACFYEDTDIAKYQSIADPITPLAMRTAAECDMVYTELVKRIKELFKLKLE